MHAPYTAQYRVIGGSGAGRGGSFTPDAAALSDAPPANVSEAPLLATAAEAAAVVAAADAVVVAAADAAGALAGFIADALFAVVAAAPLAAGAAAAGMLAPNGPAEKELGGSGGREGAPVDEVLVATGWRGGSCDSWTMLTLDSLFAWA